MSFVPRLAPRLAETFSLSFGSLAALRLGIGLILLYDLAVRAWDLRAFYTDEGLLPRSLLTLSRFYPTNGYFSLHALSGEPWLQALLFLVHAACALALLVGFRTRLAAIACWGLLLSLHNRNPYAVFGGDYLLRTMLFWGMFLPWDKGLVPGAWRPENGRVISPASVALTLHLALLFVFAGLHKRDEWSSGRALPMILASKNYATPVANQLAGFLEARPALSSFLTSAIKYGEIAAGLTLLAPGASSLLRTLTVLALVGFQLAILLLLKVFYFPVIAIVCLVALRPSPTAPLHVIRGRWQSTVVTIAMGSLIWFNLAAFRGRPFPQDHLFEAALKGLGFAQQWGYFANKIVGLDQTILWKARLQDQTPRDFENRIASLQSWSPRWFNFEQKLLITERDRKFFEAVAAYYCRVWNADASRARLASLKPQRFIPAIHSEAPRVFNLTDWVTCP